MINSFYVRGSSFRREAFVTVRLGHAVTFLLELDNEYDPNAIKLVAESLHIGYVPKELTQYVRELLPLKGHISRLEWDEMLRPIVEVSFDANTLIPTQQSLSKRS